MIDMTSQKDSLPDYSAPPIERRGSYSPFQQGLAPALMPPIATVPTGTVKLAFAVRWTVSPGRYFVGFNVGARPDGITLEVDQFDLLEFAKFQRAVIAKRGVFVAFHESRTWAEDLHKAFQAGATLDPANPPKGFQPIRHPLADRSAVSQ